MNKTWKYLFNDRIYIRGIEYFYSGFVDRIRKTKQGYKAIVHGTRDYTVEITESNGRVREMSCTCPYARSGTPCKHSAAVLCAVNEEDLPALKPGDDLPYPSAEELVSQLSEEEVRILLRDLAEKRMDIRGELLQQRRIKKAGMNDALKYCDTFEMIAGDYEDDDYNIDWYAGTDYADEFVNTLSEITEPLIEEKKVPEAFDALEQAFYVLNTVEMNGSLGEHDTVSRKIKALMKRVIALASKEEKDAIFSWFLEMNFLKHRLICEDLVPDLLKDCFKEYRYRRALLKEIKKELNEPDLPDSCLMDLLRQYRSLLLSLHKDPAEYETWLSQHRDLLAVKELREREKSKKF